MSTSAMVRMLKAGAIAAICLASLGCVVVQGRPTDAQWRVSSADDGVCPFLGIWKRPASRNRFYIYLVASNPETKKVSVAQFARFSEGWKHEGSLDKRLLDLMWVRGKEGLYYLLVEEGINAGPSPTSDAKQQAKQYMVIPVKLDDGKVVVQDWKKEGLTKAIESKVVGKGGVGKGIVGSTRSTKWECNLNDEFVTFLRNKAHECIEAKPRTKVLLERLPAIKTE